MDQDNTEGLLGYIEEPSINRGRGLSRRTAMAVEPTQYVNKKKKCNRCGESNIKFKFLNNKKEDQPRYQCPNCTVKGKPYRFNPFPIRTHVHENGYTKGPKIESEELKNLRKECDRCKTVNNAKFMGYSNGKANQPRYKCIECKNQFSPLKKSKTRNVPTSEHQLQPQEDSMQQRSFGNGLANGGYHQAHFGSYNHDGLFGNTELTNQDRCQPQETESMQQPNFTNDLANEGYHEAQFGSYNHDGSFESTVSTNEDQLPPGEAESSMQQPSFTNDLANEGYHQAQFGSYNHDGLFESTMPTNENQLPPQEADSTQNPSFANRIYWQPQFQNINHDGRFAIIQVHGFPNQLQDQQGGKELFQQSSTPIYYQQIPNLSQQHISQPYIQSRGNVDCNPLRVCRRIMPRGNNMQK